MPKTRLTPRAVAAMTTDRTQLEVWDDVVPGLVLRVGRGGAKTYLVRYRIGGRYRRLTLGRHPHITLADARAKAREEIGKAQGGADPAADRQLHRSNDVTFKALATEVLEAKAAKTRDKTRRERQRIVDVELVPRWGNRPAASVTRRDVVQLVESIARRGSPVMANRTLAAVKVIFNDGLKRGFPTLEANPAHLVEPPGDEGRRGRYLDRGEIKSLWGTLEGERPVTRALFRFTLLTAQRVGSARALRWADIDAADVWHIPAAAFKGRRPHRVPLSAEALAVLEALRPLTGGDPYVFRGRKDGKAGHASSTHRALQRIRERAALGASWTVHDFRTTFRTHATRAAAPANPKDPAGLGVAPNVADAVLGHKEASLGFDRYTAEPETYLLAEKRDALARWGAFVRAALEAK